MGRPITREGAGEFGDSHRIALARVSLAGLSSLDGWSADGWRVRCLSPNYVPHIQSFSFLVAPIDAAFIPDPAQLGVSVVIERAQDLGSVSRHRNPRRRPSGRGLLRRHRSQVHGEERAGFWQVDHRDRGSRRSPVSHLARVGGVHRGEVVHILKEDVDVNDMA